MSSKVYQRITDELMAKVKAGTLPWQRTWKELPDANIISKKPYRGCNVLMTGLQPFESPFWMTFKQAKDMGATVKKGSTGTPILFWKMGQYTPEGEDPRDEDAKKTYLIERYTTVFNLEQVEGFPEDKIPTYEALDFQPIDSAQSVLDNMPDRPDFHHDGSGRAYYHPITDSVHLPKQDSFLSEDAYYSVAFHELAHATGHPSRLNRPGITEPTWFASYEYSKEELVAEMTAAMLCGVSGIESTFDNSAAYLRSWLSKLEANPEWLIQASGQAQKAADFILGKTQATDQAQEATV